MGVPSWTGGSPGPLAALLAEGGGVLQLVWWILLLWSLSTALRLPICFPARDYKQANGLYQLVIVVENSQLSKPMNYIEKVFSPLTIPWTTQTASFSMPELMERRHNSLNSGVLLICNEGCCTSALHRCMKLIHIRKTVAGLLHRQTKLFLAYRAIPYDTGTG